MIETYAERLQKRKGNTMTNYDMDEIERQREREEEVEGLNQFRTGLSQLNLVKMKHLTQQLI